MGVTWAGAVTWAVDPALVAAARAGSLSEAARQTEVPLPTLSRRVRGLEDEVGARLLERTAHGLTLTDIGALQASAPPGSLFQVASQFNCLESPGAYVTPVAAYLGDPTQGPRASISTGIISMPWFWQMEK